MSRILPFLLLGVAQLSWAACDDALPATGSRNDVLIIVNDNAVDSCEVGRYYAEKRGLGRNNILHVKTPANPSISYLQYEILRNQILRELQQRIGGTAATCTSMSPNICAEVQQQLRTSSNIKYLVLTKGVPARIIHVVNEAWQYANPDEPGSLDGYLRNQLGSYFYPARIDGLDLAAAKRMVDRAIAAESIGLRGELQSVASKTDAAGNLPAGSRFSKSGYVLDAPVPVRSEKLKLGWTATGYQGDPEGSFLANSSFYWRYQFGLFGETDTACTGNVPSLTAGDETAFYLNNLQGSVAGKAPTQCRVKLTKGNGANPAISDLAPGFSSGRSPRVVDTIAYMGHLDNQPTFAGTFDGIKSWTRDASCVARLCKDDPVDPAACRAASTDTLKELDTRCIGVADGFIGHNFQSYPLSFFTAWPTGWHPLSAPNNGSTEPLASEIGGNGHWFVAYPHVRHDDGDGDSTSLWYGAHDKLPTTACYASDLTTTAPCSDLNSFLLGQKVASVGTRTITGTEYYRLSLSYRSTAGETSKPARLAAVITVDDTGVSPRVQRRLLSKINSLVYAPLRDTNGEVTIGINSGSTWKRASAVFKLDITNVLPGATKQIGGMAIDIYSADSAGSLSNFSGTVGIDSIVLEKVDANDVAEVPALGLVNGDFNDGHKQFAIGDWAATFTSRLNGVGFWGSTTHNCGGTSVFTRLTDTLADFVGGEDLATAVWDGEGCYGGQLYGDPLYSPVAVKLNALTQRFLFTPTLALTGNVFNGSGSGIDTRYEVHYCYGKDFFTCDRTSAWVATNIVATTGQPQGRNIALGAISTTGIDRARQFLLRLTVRSTKGGKETVYSDFSQPMTGFDATGQSDSDGISDGDELALGTDPVLSDTDGDGLADNVEIAHGLNPLIKDTKDSDKDGLPDALETVWGSNPNEIDSDGDGYPDMAEWSAAGNTAATINDASLHPSYGIAPIPPYARAGREYRHTLVGATPSTTVGLNLVGIKIQSGDLVWTPSINTNANALFNVKFSNPTAWYQIVVIQLDGDINEDGKLNLADLLLMKKFVTGEVQPTTRQIYHADFYPLSESGGVPDNKLDLSDLIVMEKKLLANPK